ncbi:aspartic proteinase CDR1-like [Quercus suber]|uniref:Aspartic proteinase cdr1 n=1 Tax=Quercus suber TaxID=58331 RepID=A0AAW0LFV2_QUESU
MASSVKFHPYFLLSYYLIGLLVTAHNVPQAQLIPYYGQHLMKASIGTPPVDIYSAIDTASDLVWTKCVPCDVCFSRIHPKFDPKRSCTSVTYWTKSIVLLKIVAITSMDIQISFDNGSEVVGDGVVSTPFVAVGNQYYVTLEGISVGDTYVPFNSSGKVSKGNICIDLGSPPLTLPPDFYNRLEVEVKKQIPIDPIKNETLTGTRLCYRTETTNENGPKLTVHFEGADVELKPILTFNRPVHAYDIYCFAITNTANTALADLGDQGLYGNYVQANLLIGFDLETRMVSFKPTDCTQL